MSPGALIDQLIAVGIRLGVEDGQLYADVLPTVNLSEYEGEIQEHRQALVAELQRREQGSVEHDSEVVRRVTAMRPQVPSRGPIPVLLARDVIPASTGCISCGEPVSADRRYRCELCAQAAAIVLCETRE